MTVVFIAYGAYVLIWFRYNSQLNPSFSLVDGLLVLAVLVSALWAILLAGAHHRIEIADDHLIISRCWYWRSTKLPAVPKHDCWLTIAPCALLTHIKGGMDVLNAHWVELVLPDSYDRVVLACFVKREDVLVAAEELRRATGVQVARDSAERRYLRFYPVIPRPRLALMLVKKYVLGK